MPSTNENIEPKAKLMLVKARRSTIGSSARNTRQKNSTAPITMTIENTNTLSSCSQSLRGPSSSTYSSEPRNAAIPASPNQSNFCSSPGSGLSKSISVQADAATSTPGKTLIRNSQCQESAWLI